jgi:hypothetical protein
MRKTMRKTIISTGLSALGLASALSQTLLGERVRSKRGGNYYQPFSESRRPSLQQRDPKDPHQSQRIAAAVAKRERKAEKLYWNMNHAMRCNKAHRHERVLPHRLNPFYIEGSNAEVFNYGGE